MNTGPLEDLVAIRDLNESFAIAAVRKDIGKWGATWAEDSSWMLPILAEPVLGKANIIATMDARFPLTKLLSMVVFGAEIQVDGDTATGKIYHQEIVFPNSDEGRKFLIGCYHDKYIKLDGRWYFAFRDYEVFGRA